MGFRWQGPLSLAVYAPGTDFETALETIFFYRFSKIKIFCLIIKQGHVRMNDSTGSNNYHRIVLDQ